MANSKMDDYINQGIHGVKEIKPDERRKFLGTLRERVVIALQQYQVRKPDIYPEVEEAIKNNAGAKLLLNGNVEYESISKYKQMADKYKMEYSIVTNKDHNSEIGLLVAYDHAIEKEDIFVNDQQEVPEEPEEKKGFFSSLGKLFK